MGVILVESKLCTFVCTVGFFIRKKAMMALPTVVTTRIASKAQSQTCLDDSGLSGMFERPFTQSCSPFDVTRSRPIQRDEVNEPRQQLRIAAAICKADDHLE